MTTALSGTAPSGVALILLVEDERPLREVLAEVLVWGGYRVRQAHHGRHALELIERERPDLIISDVMMPDVGGVELCQRLKANAATASIPIVLMSAGTHVGQDALADAFVAKPFDLDAMEALVRRLLVGNSA